MGRLPVSGRSSADAAPFCGSNRGLGGGSGAPRGVGAKSDPGAAELCGGAACHTASGRTRGGTRLLVRLPLTCGVGMAAHGNSDAGSGAGSHGGEPETGTCRTVGRESVPKAGRGALSGAALGYGPASPSVPPLAGG